MAPAGPAVGDGSLNGSQADGGESDDAFLIGASEDDTPGTDVGQAYLFSALGD